jgi:uncharacterized membrane protein YedE/YeeE
MSGWLLQPWPWYVAGPVIGLFPALVLLLGNRQFGVSSTLRHVCAASCPGTVSFFQYDWRREGAWNIAFTAGILIGGILAGAVFGNPGAVGIASETRAALQALGVSDFSGLMPSDHFSWTGLLTARGAALILGGGFLVGFGTAYAGGCTSGHGLAGIADLQLPSLVALFGFFAGGIAATFLVLPLVL